VANFQKRTGQPPVNGSLVGYVTCLSIFAGVKKAGSTDTDRLIAALEGLTVTTPIGPITYRPFDHQSTMGAWVGVTRRDPARGVGIMADWAYVPGEQVLPGEAEVRSLRGAGR
jgi:branched-chain amino acid transport system substrate-binding protein